MAMPRPPASCVNWSRNQLQALVDADGDTLDLLLADDFVLVPPPGTPLTKDEYLGAVESGDLDFERFDPISPIEVSVYGASRGPDLQVRHRRHRCRRRHRAAPGMAHRRVREDVRNLAGRARADHRCGRVPSVEPLTEPGRALRRLVFAPFRPNLARSLIGWIRADAP